MQDPYGIKMSMLSKCKSGIKQTPFPESNGFKEEGRDQWNIYVALLFHLSSYGKFGGRDVLGNMRRITNGRKFDDYSYISAIRKLEGYKHTVLIPASTTNISCLFISLLTQAGDI
ncbi:hypothetical protein FRX31_010673 [Thalictrum thalictroides]|uniref:Uncharacterized protein n=1 Tax=Thalictrum thalictroides TaxID=46969 RepID=A0A7J6WSX8_THATH|nr:hypothetical protein FRX31_010673 [Thalictrum thalictroides]